MNDGDHGEFVLHGQSGRGARICRGDGVVGPGRSQLVDSWRDQAALDAHHASPMMATIAELREKYDLHMRVERFVTDAAGVPSQDAAFIRA